jgi:hypothetical protein
VSDEGTEGGCDPEDCGGSVRSTQGEKGNPINTRTGNHTYQAKDVSVSTPAGELAFVRSYSTFNARRVATDLLIGTDMSPGWNHNFDMRLIFSDQSGGQPDTVKLRTSGGSRLKFYETAPDTFLSEYGAIGDLSYNGDSDEYVYRIPSTSRRK